MGEAPTVHPDVTAHVRTLAEAARRAARQVAALPGAARDAALQSMAQSLRAAREVILGANRADVDGARARNLAASFVERLTLDATRLDKMVAHLEAVAELPDPLGRATTWRRPNGLEIQQVRVPLGVIGVIYESRPDVTADVSALAIKAGNGVVLRGGSEALATNGAIAEALQQGLAGAGVDPAAIGMVRLAGRASAVAMMEARGLLDLLIPRGGAELIRTVVEHAQVPVIETGVGNCHVYVHADAPYEMAERIVINAKTQRPSVCNAAETLLVHRGFGEHNLGRLAQVLRDSGVELRGCPTTREWIPWARPADETDWATEFLDLILAVRVVDSLEEAITHIQRYGTGHSEAIVTRDLTAARRFTEAVDAAAVYVNASTRFTDGYQFGFGAEVGISTQKLHARGPMGLEALTSVKYVVYGDGQIREA